MLRERILQHFCVGCSAEKHFRHWSAFQAVPRADIPVADERFQECVLGLLINSCRRTARPKNLNNANLFNANGLNTFSGKCLMDNTWHRV